jgi:hypothetical protein
MEAGPSVFERTYQDYLARIATIEFPLLEKKLGGRLDEDRLIISVFGTPHTISKMGISDPTGHRPMLDVCVILFKYLILCPENPPQESGWVSYRDFKDTGPLTTYFVHDVEQAIISRFSGRLDELTKACVTLGGKPPEMTLSYDVSMQCDALPRVSVLLLFNDADDEFPAKCSVLFDKSAENYLDAECLAMLGRLFFIYLKEVH